MKQLKNSVKQTYHLKNYKISPTFLKAVIKLAQKL